MCLVVSCILLPLNTELIRTAPSSYIFCNARSVLGVNVHSGSLDFINMLRSASLCLLSVFKAAAQGMHQRYRATNTKTDVFSLNSSMQPTRHSHQAV